MNKKLPKLNKKDRDRQIKIADKLKKENIELGHPQGKERFDKVIRKVLKKK